MIKVAVILEEEPISKFEALAKQYSIAKEIATETESMKQPIINVVGEEKLKVIYQQLETIKDHLKFISDNRGYGVEGAHAYKHRNVGCDNVSVKYYPLTDKLELSINGWNKPKPEWFAENGIITNWNKYDIYGQLERSCEKQIEAMIHEQEEKARKINSNYDNMLNN